MERPVLTKKRTRLCYSEDGAGPSREAFVACGRQQPELLEHPERSCRLRLAGFPVYNPRDPDATLLRNLPNAVRGEPSPRTECKGDQCCKQTLHLAPSGPMSPCAKYTPAAVMPTAAHHASQEPRQHVATGVPAAVQHASQEPRKHVAAGSRSCNMRHISTRPQQGGAGSAECLHDPCTK